MNDAKKPTKKTKTPTRGVWTMSASDQEVMDQLMQKYGLDRSSVIRLALRQLASQGMTA